MRLKLRNINKGEKFACNIKDIKRIFDTEPDDVHIGFGYYHRAHQFDHTDNRHPDIYGTIIASAMINMRENNYVGAMRYESTYFISFYVIKDEAYTADIKNLFVATRLPSIYQWYQAMRVKCETAQSGVENLLIEWRNGNFIEHQYRYR